MVRGDIMRARALYERAAAIHPGSSAAPIAAGKTYDPNFLPIFGSSNSMADPAKAGEWYQRARALGDPAAAALLAALR
jgi:TPR repeat protein